MKITNIEQQKRNANRVNIYCDGTYTFSLTKNGLVDYYIYVDKEITKEEIEDITKKDNVNSGMNYALNYLGYGMKTKQEIYNKLVSKDIEEQYIDIIIKKLESYGYINDIVYIETYIKSKAIPSKWGKQKVIQNLMQKGIDRKTVEEIINQNEDFLDNEDRILSLAQKKYNSFKKEDNEYKKKDKVSKYLLSRGYSWEEISSVWDKLEKE